ncbi:MAG: glycoside hydrolase family 99-like domain-containing protein [Proteiniphilum sp.]|nr:glycoside hydrolase family 99-like domain-containing protein [Proteiniphilum sp.]
MKFKYIIIALFLSGLFASCTEESGPSIDDYPLNYQIEPIAVTQDIPVGIYLYNPATALANEAIWTRLTESHDEATGKVGPNVEPVLGKYTLGVNDEGAQNLQTLFNWCKDARIDFIVSTGLKENANALYPNNINTGDSAFIRLISGQHANYPVDMGDMKYAILMDINNFCSGLSNNALLENAATQKYTYTDEDGIKRDTTLTREERLYNLFRRASDFFRDDTYFHLNGRPVLVLANPEKLFTAKSKEVYDGIRRTIREHTGKDVYLIARQTQWTPPARFHDHFLSGGVDAVTMDNMCNVGAGYYERLYWLNQFINENFKYNREYISAHYGIDFIPSVAASYNIYVNNGSYNSPIVSKNADEFRKRCNVAKMNLGKTPLVLVESLNNWQYDAQIEPSVVREGSSGYGTIYLDILKEQFKRN